MSEVIGSNISCPCCGESTSLLVDNPLPERAYAEHCRVVTGSIWVPIGATVRDN